MIHIDAGNVYHSHCYMLIHGMYCNTDCVHMRSYRWNVCECYHMYFNAIHNQSACAADAEKVKDFSSKLQVAIARVVFRGFVILVMKLANILSTHLGPPLFSHMVHCKRTKPGHTFSCVML